MWTNNFTNRWMVELETIIVLATVICIIETNLYESHPMNELVFNDFY